MLPDGVCSNALPMSSILQARGELRRRRSRWLEKGRPGGAAATPEQVASGRAAQVPDCRSRTERVDMLQLLDVSTMDAGGAGGFFDSNSILNHGC
jgi:hypothetical protein